MGIELGTTGVVYCMLAGTRASWGPADANGFAAGAAPSGLTALNLVKDISLPLNKSDADATTRLAGKWKITGGGMRDVAVDLPVLWDKTDPCVMGLMNAWISDNTIPIAILDGPSTENGSVGFWADFAVLDAKKGEKLGEFQEMIYTIKPGYSQVQPQIVIVTGGTGSGFVGSGLG